MMEHKEAKGKAIAARKLVEQQLVAKDEEIKVAPL
jgi:hypothetical protein